MIYASKDAESCVSESSGITGSVMNVVPFIQCEPDLLILWKIATAK